MVKELGSVLGIDYYARGSNTPYLKLGTKGVGYCSLSSDDVFCKIFPDYHITSFNNIDLFSNWDTRDSLNGISIGRIPVVSGIWYGLGDVLNMDGFSVFRRKKGVSRDEVGSILKNLISLFDELSGDADMLSITGSEIARGYISSCEEITRVINLVSNFV